MLPFPSYCQVLSPALTLLGKFIVNEYIFSLFGKKTLVTVISKVSHCLVCIEKVFQVIIGRDTYLEKQIGLNFGVFALFDIYICDRLDIFTPTLHQ